MSEDDGLKAMGQVIQIDEARIRDHLGAMVRGTVEETLNALLDASAAIFPFRTLAESGETPRLFGAEPPRPRIEAVRRYKFIQFLAVTCSAS